MCAKSSASPQASNVIDSYANHRECSSTVMALDGTNPEFRSLSLVKAIFSMERMQFMGLRLKEAADHYQLL